MKTNVLVVALVLVIGVLFAGRIQSAPPRPSVNIGQFTAPQGGLNCLGFNFAPTDLEVTLETEGRPVLVSFTVQTSLGAQTGILLRPTIDGVSPDASLTRPAFVRQSVSSSQLSTLQLARVFNVAAGTHVFGVQMACEGVTLPGYVTLGPRWLTVYEFQGR